MNHRSAEKGMQILSLIQFVCSNLGGILRNLERKPEMIQGETISGSPEGKPHGCADHSAELSSLKFMLESNAKLLDPSSEQLQKRERERVGFSKDCDERDCYRKKQEHLASN